MTLILVNKSLSANRLEIVLKVYAEEFAGSRPQCSAFLELGLNAATAGNNTKYSVWECDITAAAAVSHLSGKERFFEETPVKRG